MLINRPRRGLTGSRVCVAPPRRAGPPPPPPPPLPPGGPPAGREGEPGRARAAPALAVAAAVHAGGARGERVGDAEQVLDDAVVQVGGDQPPLGLRRVERMLEQRLALAPAFPQPPGERAREREVDELQQQQ